MIRNTEVIGEATKNLSPELEASNAEISQERIAGLRDRVIPADFGVDLELVGR